MYSSLLQSYISANTATQGNFQNLGGAVPAQTLPALVVKNQQTKGFTPSEIQIEANQNPDETKERKKKKLIAKVALISAAVAGATVVAVAAFRHTGGVIKNARNFISKLRNHNVTPPEISQESLTELQKGADNINNAKDSISRHFLMKLPFYEKFDNFVSGKYRQAGLKTTTKGWARAKKSFFKAEEKIVNTLSNADFDEVKGNRIRELLQKRHRMIETAANTDSIKSRVEAVDKSLNRLDKDGWERITKVKEEGFFKGIKKLSREALAEKRINKAKEAQNKLLKPLMESDLTADESGELKELLKELKEKSNGRFMGDFMESSWFLKHAKTKESKDLFGKLRDINYGCAPTDIINMGITAGMLGIYTAQADSKEERVSVTLTTGIPLLAAFGTCLFATNKMVSGAKAMCMGLLSGFAANKIGNKINEKYKEYNGIEETPKTIDSLDDYKDKVVQAGVKAGESILSVTV